MKFLSKLLLMVSILALTLSNAAADPLRVFIRGGAKTHGPNQHDHPRFLKEWTQLLGERGMKVSGDMDFPEPQQLDNTDVLIIYAADGMSIKGERRVQLEKFLQRGGGLVVLHDGVVSGDQHEWCKSIIGGAWRWPSADMPQAKATKWYEGDVGICWVDMTNAISKGISNFDWKDEVYFDMDISPEVSVLATSMHNVHIIAPQIWTYEKTLPGGSTPYRAFVSIPGHEYDVFNTPHYRAILMRGIAWAGKRANLDEFCSKEELGSLVYPAGGPLPSAEALKTFSLHPEFDISVVADEKIAEKLMSVEWDPKGRLWVVETPEYPNGRQIHQNDSKITPWRLKDPAKYPIGGTEPRAPHDRISILESSKGDGVMDKKTVFADNLELATSVVLYKNGAIVAQAPEILFVSDTRGTGKADKVEVLFSGWGTGDTHAVISNLRWGPDGWVYGSVGYSSGDVTSGDKTKKFGHIAAGIFRFRPDGSALEQVAVSSCNTWGCEIAPDGDIFYSTATCGEPILHVVLPEKTISLAGVPGMRGVRPIMGENKVFPSRKETRQPYLQIDWVGAFTAAAGSCIYDGGAWPAKWEGPSWSFFVHEPTVWLMHHEILDPQGVTYLGHKEEGRKETEFLTSTDYWFKPIHSRVGPDGAIYLVDMYNQIAVHNDTRGPAHGAHNAAARPDRNHHFTRLYRIQHKEAKALPAFELDAKNPAKLVEMLNHPNGWVRTTANRLLSEGSGKDVVSALEQQARDASTAYGRMQALWVLQNLNALDGELLVGACNDKDPVVRRTAMRISAARDNSRVDAPMDLVHSCLNDSDARERILALVACETLPATPDLAAAIVDAWPTFKDPYMETAALAVAARNPVMYLGAALDARDPDLLAGLVTQLARQVANQNNPDSAASLIRTLASRPATVDRAKASVLQAFTSALKPGVVPKADPELGEALKKLLQSDLTSGPVLPLVVRWNFAETLRDAAKAPVAAEEMQLASKSLSDARRGEIALNLVGARSIDAGIIPAVAGLLGTDTSEALQKQIIEALGSSGDAAAGKALLDAMPKLSAELRDDVFDQMVRRATWAENLVQAIADKKVDLNFIGPANSYRLMTHSDAAVAAHAKKVVTAVRGPIQSQKDSLIAGLRPEIIKPGDALKGKKLFIQNCSICHKFKNDGADFAPNLTGMGAHGPEELIVHIVDPNRYVEPNYFTVSIETKDGLSYDAIVLRENDKSVVLRNQAGQFEIRKDNIQTRVNTTRSLMPEGFEALGAENLRDLLSYICADNQHFHMLDMSPAFTANTTHGIYASVESREESLRFKRWGAIEHHGIPFDILNPLRTTNGLNVVVLKGGAGISKNYPQQVEVKVGLQVSKLHFLGGVAGWGFPGGKDGEPAAKVVVHYEGGATEELVLHNGVEFADYIAHIDVPGSEALENLDQLLLQGRQLRYFAKPLTKKGRVEKLVISSYDNEVAPTFVAITAEIGEPSPAAAAAPSGASALPELKWGAGIKTLIFGGGSSHDFDKWFNQSDVKNLNAAGGITANYVDPSGDLSSLIEGADVLIICNNKPFTSPETKVAIFGHLAKGKGIIGLHPGLWYNWNDWPEYNRTLIGGGAHGHNPYGSYDVVTTHGDHPVMTGVPSTFAVKDELYHFEIDPNGSRVEVLAKAHSAKDNIDYPQVFIVNQPKGRVVGITLGHDGSTHENEAYLHLLRNSVFWCAGKDVK